jgi:tetratricopeptide (TPR) repeat protein
MEYINGDTLQNKLDSGEITLESALEYAGQITDALAEAHDKGIIHRDIKPGNIMIDSSGRMKVLDFGLAKLKGSTPITQTGTTVGTVAYMSPEQIQAKQVDHRADLFSLGVVLFELLTGERPFKGQYDAALTYAIANEDPPLLSELKPKLPDELSRVVNRLLEKDPEDRYQSAEELGTELKTFISSSSGEHQETSTTNNNDSRVISGSTKWIARIAMAVIPLLAIIGGFFYFNQETNVSEDFDSNRVAVVVFENQTGDSTLNPVGRMAADWLIQGIARTEFVDIVPSEVSLSSYQEGETLQHNIERISEISEANIIIAGNYYRQDSLISINPRIYDVKNNEFLIPIDPVQGDVDTPMDVVGRLQQRVMGAMASVFDERIHLYEGIVTEPPSYNAYSEFIQGLEQFLNHRNFQEAILHFETAFEQDTTFVSPLLLQAIAHLNLQQPEKSDSLATMLSGNLKNQLIPSDRLMVDWLQADLEGNRQQALHSARQAGKLARGTGHNYQWGLEALKMNRPTELIEAFKTIDPKSPLMDGWFPYWGILCGAHHKIGNHEKELKLARRARLQYPEINEVPLFELRAQAALGKLEEVLQLAENSELPEPRWQITAAREFIVHGFDQQAETIYGNLQTYFKNNPPDSNSEYLQQGVFYFDTNQTEKAIKNFREHFNEDTDTINWLGHYGTTLAKAGERERALEVVNRLREIDRDYIHGINYRWMAAIRAQLGEPEQAMDLLREAHKRGMSYDLFLHLFIELEPLFRHPEFIEFMEPKGENV